MILVEVEAAVDPAGSVVTYRLATAPFITEPGDSLPNIVFDDDLQDPGTLGVSVYADGTTGGQSRLEAGTIRVENIDGEYDDWRSQSFDGRSVLIRTGPEGGSYPNDFPVIMAGTMEGVEVGWDEAVLTIRDQSFVFDKAILTVTFAGTNSGPTGIEGTADDLKGAPKPRVLGAVANIEPPCVNTSKLTFKVSDGPVTSIAVYDRGVALDLGSDRASAAALAAAVIAAGAFDTCLAEGLFRLGADPDGQVTADVAEGASDADRTVAQLLRALALDAGVSALSIDEHDVSVLDSLNPAVVGYWISGEETYREVMDAIAASIGAFYSFGPTGILHMGRLDEPTGMDSIGEITTADLDGEPTRRAPNDNGIPVWSVAVRYGKLWTVQASDVAVSVTPARKAYLKQEYRTAADSDATVKDQFRLAGKLVVDTVLRGESNALAEAARLMDLHSVPRDIFEVPISLEFLAELAPELGDEITMTLDRFGLEAGQDFIIIGIRIDLEDEAASLSLWG